MIKIATLSAVLIGVTSATLTRAAEAPYAIVAAEADRIHAELQFEIEAPHLQATEWVVVVAKPPTLPSQRDVRVTFDSRAESVTEIGGVRRQVLRLRAPVESAGAKPTSFSSRVSYDATLIARRLVRREAGGEGYEPFAPLSKAEREAALRRTPLFDFAAAPFTQWRDEHDLRRRAGEHDVDLARRAFRAVVESTKYEYANELDRKASSVCRAGASDCGGMSVAFCSLLRAEGVPARVLVGCWAKSAEPGATLGGYSYYQTHVIAEFFADGVGWVPVDCASAVLHDRSQERLRYFGNDRGDFLTLHVDPELKVDSVHFGTKTLPWLQQFHFFVRGKGSAKNWTANVEWTVEKQ